MKTIGTYGVAVMLILCMTVPVFAFHVQGQETIALVAKVKPTVVRVLRVVPEADGQAGVDNLPRYAESKGSGVIISPDGYILTNNHVMTAEIPPKFTGLPSSRVNAESGYIELASGKRFFAKVIGRDSHTDLALLKIETSDPLPYARLSADPPQVGEPVLTMGHPLGFEYTATFGIVSGLDRLVNTQFVKYIQTDAAINLGNSGGPLFNTNGEVIGINTIIIAVGQNMGFAVPSATIRGVIPELQAHGKISRGYMGIEMKEIPETGQGPVSVMVNKVAEGGPAEKADIHPGDVLARLNGTPIQNMTDVFKTISGSKPGTVVIFEIQKPNGDRSKVRVTLGELPERPNDDQ